MDIRKLSEAVRTQEQLNELQSQYEAVEKGVGFTLTIQSRYQDDTFLNAIRPHVLSELSKLIAEKKESLAKLGVTFP